MNEVSESTEQLPKRLLFIETTVWLKRRCLDVQSGRWVTQVKGEEVKVHNKQFKFHSLTLEDAINFRREDAETFNIYYNEVEHEQYNRSTRDSG